jgi:hypothetical protein
MSEYIGRKKAAEKENTIFNISSFLSVVLVGISDAAIAASLQKKKKRKGKERGETCTSLAHANCNSEKKKNQNGKKNSPQKKSQLDVRWDKKGKGLSTRSPCTLSGQEPRKLRF